MDLLRKDIEEGGFYYTSSNIDPPQVVSITWYLKDGLLRNPTCYQDVREGHNWFFKPVTLEDICISEPHTCHYEEWIKKHGDIEGQLAWENYKAKLRMRDMERKEEEEVKMKNDVDLYDPKFVHFDWDESLIGKKGFYSDHIDGLKYDVRNDKYMGVCDQLGDSGCPFRIKDKSIYRFFYYDPNYKIKWAYFKEGKTIQYKGTDGIWKDTDPAISPRYFDDSWEYRIKPEEPTDKIKVDVKIQVQPSVDKINIIVNGKACTFENVEDARKVLGLDVKEVADE